MSMYDINNDGLTDSGVVDTDGDGFGDQNILDLNADGLAETWAMDHNQDGIADEVAFDNNADGVADVWGVDANQDQLVERVHTDANLDGLPDAVPVYDAATAPWEPSAAIVGPATNLEPGTAPAILEQARQTTDPVLQQQLLELARITANHNDEMIDTILSDVTVDLD